MKFYGNISDFHSYNTGVIQGLGLGPVLFICVMAELGCINSGNCMIKYTDDCLLLIPESNNNTLQDEIEHLYQWSAIRNLNVNSNKSKIMVVSTKRKSLNFNIDSSLSDIPYVKDMVILGVHLQHNISFESQIML